MNVIIAGNKILNMLKEKILEVSMRIHIENLHRELRRLRSEVTEMRFLMRGVFMDEEGIVRESVLRDLAKAKMTPKSKYIPHEEVEKWFGKSSGTRKRSKR